LTSLGLFISTARLKMMAVTIAFIWWKEIKTVEVSITDDIED